MARAFSTTSEAFLPNSESPFGRGSLASGFLSVLPRCMCVQVAGQVPHRDKLGTDGV